MNDVALIPPEDEPLGAAEEDIPEAPPEEAPVETDPEDIADDAPDDAPEEAPDDAPDAGPDELAPTEAEPEDEPGDAELVTTALPPPDVVLLVPAPELLPHAASTSPVIASTAVTLRVRVVVDNGSPFTKRPRAPSGPGRTGRDGTDPPPREPRKHCVNGAVNIGPPA